MESVFRLLCKLGEERFVSTKINFIEILTKQCVWIVAGKIIFKYEHEKFH